MVLWLAHNNKLEPLFAIHLLNCVCVSVCVCVLKMVLTVKARRATFSFLSQIFGEIILSAMRGLREGNGREESVERERERESERESVCVLE